MKREENANGRASNLFNVEQNGHNPYNIDLNNGNPFNHKNSDR